MLPFRGSKTLFALLILWKLFHFSLSTNYVPIIDTPVIETLTQRTITLSCKVNFVGETLSLTWINNIGLFITERSLPPRYTLTQEGGTSRLTISDVQPTDDGKYFCIFGTDAGGHTLESRDITVKVFVKPGRPTIAGLVNAAIEPVSRGQPVEIVTISHSAPTAKISCTVGPAKPAFPIKWFLDGVALTAGVAPTVTNTGPDNLETTVSELTINQPGERFNGAQYKCIADLEQIDLDIISTIAPIETVFNLSVYMPPSNPVIEGADPDVVKQRGDSVKLICKTIGGNPLPTLQWYRNDVSYNHEFRTVEESGEVKSELLIEIEAADNNAVYRCDAMSAAIPEPKSASVTLSVRFAPDKATITGNEPVKSGDSLVLSCTTSNSNPKAEITWFSRVRTVDSDDQVVEYTESEDGGYITQSNITVVPTKLDHETEYMCRAHNPEVTDVVSDTVKLNVLYPPDSIEITGYNESVSVRVDTAHKMTCTSNEGNPPPDLTWYSGSTKITNDVGQTKAEGRMRYREVNFIAKAKNNGARFSCTATSDATTEPLRSEYIDIKVYFPSTNVVITPEGPLREGVSVTLECNSGSSNPQSTITWAKNNTELSSPTSDIKHVRYMDGKYNGRVTVSSYTFTPLASENGMIILCSARNREIGRYTTQGLALNILHKPKFIGVPTVIRLQEGKNKTNNNFTATANPPEVTYTWFKIIDGVETKIKFPKKREITIPELTAADGFLNLVNVNRDMAGNYRVKGTNSEGTSFVDFEIDVQYGAGIKGKPTQTENADGLSLHCIIDANPPVDLAHARWNRLDYNLERGDQAITGAGNTRTLTLTINNVVRNDIGTFTCEANNTFGSVSMEYSVNPVPFPPDIDRAPSTSKSAAQTHDDGYIKCNMDAFPAPTIKWSKGDDPITLDNVKYDMSTKTVGKIKFSYTLTIKNVGESDYGSYRCTAENLRGTDSHDIILTGTSKPDPPTNITVLNSTDFSVMLSWIPGFDGGLEQKYNIRYHSPGSSYLYADAPSPPFTVRGLDPDTEYEFTVQAFNDLGESNYQVESVKARTLATTTSKPIVTKPDEPMFIVIMALAVVFGLLLIVTTVLVCIFVRRRRKRILSDATDSASQSNTDQLYGTSVGSQSHDEARSYSTYYEKGYEDDYAKHYEDDDNELNNAKSVMGTGNNYVSADVIPYTNDTSPWSKTEVLASSSGESIMIVFVYSRQRGGGNFGNYGRQYSSVVTGSSYTADEDFANKLRDATLAMQQPRPDNYQRPAFINGRPPAPKPPMPASQYADVPPLVPERNYSPQIDYNIYPGDMGHTSFIRTPTPSMNNVDDKKGALV